MSHIMLVKILFCYDFRDFVQKFIRGILLEFCHSSRHMALQAYRSKRSSTFMLCSVFVVGIGLLSASSEITVIGSTLILVNG